MAAREARGLTQAQYAAHRKAQGLPGGSREAVRKAIEEGRISTIAGKIYPQLADAEWAKNTRARVSPQAAKGSDGEQDTQRHAAETVAAAMPPAADGYTESRARRERAEAEMAEMNARKARGALIEREDVARGGFEVGRDIRDALAAAVNPLSAELAPVSSAEACAEILRRHNRAVCELLVKAWRERIAAPAPGELVE
jgi:hypothetical protein